MEQKENGSPNRPTVRLLRSVKSLRCKFFSLWITKTNRFVPFWHFPDKQMCGALIFIPGARCLFLDFISALNTIRPTSLTHQLVYMELHTNIINLVYSFTTDRSQHVKTEAGIFDSCTTNIGSPQLKGVYWVLCCFLYIYKTMAHIILLIMLMTPSFTSY